MVDWYVDMGMLHVGTNRTSSVSRVTTNYLILRSVLKAYLTSVLPVLFVESVVNFSFYSIGLYSDRGLTVQL